MIVDRPKAHRPERRRTYYLTHKSEIKIRSQAYYLAHKDRIKAHDKTYYFTHLKQVKARHKIYSLAHLEQNRTRNKTYRLVNKEKIKIYKKGYYLANKREKLNYAKKYQREYPEKARKHMKTYRFAHPERVAERAKITSRKRKALKLGVGYKPYTDTYIFERDGWICQICGRKINKKLKWPNPLSKSIDHIIPFIRGGSDSPINVQAAHLRCNLSKNAGSGGQLRLIG